MTPAENVLWHQLRNRGLDGMKFTRQHPIEVVLFGREEFVVVDFYCHARGLIVEIDGPVHLRQHLQDAARTKALEALGLRVIRFTNDQVQHDLGSVLRAVSKECGLDATMRNR